MDVNLPREKYENEEKHTIANNSFLLLSCFRSVDVYQRINAFFHTPKNQQISAIQMREIKQTQIRF